MLLARMSAPLRVVDSRVLCERPRKYSLESQRQACLKPMSAYKEVLVIEPGASDARLSLARAWLAGGSGVVMLGDDLALRSTGDELICEVVDLTPSAHRCANEYEVMVENAQRALHASGLDHVLPRLPCKWLVVEDCGTGVAELWRAPPGER